LARSRKKSNSDDASLFDTAAGTSASDNGHVVSLHETAQERYLNYALSVITSRALPDVRDGLKPVQRRILYTMWQHRITADAKHRKCAKIVGDVMGNYHPHGNEAIYDTLVRMAQPFSLRIPLIDGSGNFGSLDGDNAAAMRYTECRLQRIADEMLAEIGQKTVHFRPNYDNTREEPVVLPARLPNLLVNGGTGIAVGMATNIPPHNLGEVCDALLRFLDALSKDRDIQIGTLANLIKGPDFPTGGQIITPPAEIREIYATGAGSIRTRATWEKGETKRGAKFLNITSIPYGVNKAQLVERIGDIVLGRRMPHIVNVTDLSTDDVRIALELKTDADENKVMAYLFKHTPLQNNFAVNLTCLVPTENPEVGRPERCDLKTILWHFLHFRLTVVTKRLEHELAQLERRIHILEGFVTIFDALDDILKIIRASDGKQDAADKIIKKYPLDAEQTDAILELKLYRLAKLEILVIRQEMDEKQKRVREIKKLLTSEGDRWSIVRDEIKDIQKTYGKDRPRLTRIAEEVEEVEYSAEDFIIDEDCVVIATRDGWIKRQKEVKDLATQRLREGDDILAAEAGSTRATIVFFSNFGTAYTARMIDIPPTTGYGEPIQKLFKLKDGEKLVQAISLDPRVCGNIKEQSENYSPERHALAVTSDGYALRFGLEPFVEVSTRNGRKYARPTKGATVIGVETVSGLETIIAATHKCRAMICSAEEINYLAGPGKGVILIKTAKDDYVIGFIASTGDRDLMVVETNRGATKTISTGKYEVTGRGGKGREIQKNGTFKRIVTTRDDIGVPAMVED
jgi:DNA gyrase subunit A